MTDFLSRIPADLEPVAFADLPGVPRDSVLAAWPAFLRSCARLVEDLAVTRQTTPHPKGLLEAATAAVAARGINEESAREYFSRFFSASHIRPHPGRNPYDRGFVTGYYEPEIEASRVRSASHVTPVLGRPSDLRSDVISVGSTTYTSSRMLQGRLQPYWSRAEIDEGKCSAPVIAWVRDPIELFMIQVQGSARLNFPGEPGVRLAYDGRNGHPYESIGKILVSEGHIRLEDMSLDSLKTWVRKEGQLRGQAGLRLLHRNPSYVFFKLVPDSSPEDGPVGGEGVPLTKLRSLAVDRSIWSYGLPFWISGSLPGEDGPITEFQRLMIAQDTGSAIIGAARGDIFFGSGDAAGQAAARVRHYVDMYVLLPKG
jgi:membrane-bound lytic murein transglycosylase A